MANVGTPAALVLVLNHFYSQHITLSDYPHVRFPDLRVATPEVAANFTDPDNKEMCAWVSIDRAIYIKPECAAQGRPYLNYYIAHELCHLMLDDEVLIVWGRLSVPQRATRHKHVEACAYHMLFEHKNCRLPF